MKALDENYLIETVELNGGADDLTEDVVWATLARGGFSRTNTMSGRFDAQYPLALSLLEPRALARILRASSLSEGERTSLPEPIRKAEFLSFCLATAGRAIDERARALCDEGELIGSMVLDAVAMASLSRIGDRLARELFRWASDRSLPASRAFSPGAGASYWGLEHQRLIFDHLPQKPLDVDLTDRFLMKPLKSVSFVIGIGAAVTQAMHPFSCEGCTRIDCAYRHIPEDEMVGDEAA